jgi:two-component system chemotaxis response regulator CheY
MKVMVVDDSAIMRKLISRFSREFGHEIIGEAGDGEQALKVAREKNPDLVTMDLTMPNMDGLTCIKELMKLKPETKIIAISAQSSEQAANQAMLAGARSFLVKPFNADQLHEKFREAGVGV